MNIPIKNKIFLDKGDVHKVIATLIKYHCDMEDDSIVIMSQDFNTDTVELSISLCGAVVDK